jgi:DNA-binding FadR family transcriptional regulator
VTRVKTRVSEDVAAHIVRAFYSDGLKPGEWLGTEANLAERFNVSRVTMRVGAGGGLRIASGDPDRLIDAFSIQLRLMGLSRDELFEAMLAIEPVTAALAAQRASLAELAALQDLVDQSRAAIETPQAFTQLAVSFHQAVAEASSNRALRASLAALRTTQLAHLGPETTRPIAERVARVHASILDAIAARDAELARERMREHLAAVSHAGV